VRRLHSSFSAVGYNFLVAAFVLEWALIVRGYMFDFDVEKQTFPIDIERIVVADFVAAAILISFGAVLGKTNPTQLIVMAFIEVLLQSANEFIGLRRFCAYDIGESMFVHVFGKISDEIDDELSCDVLFLVSIIV
jgi:ammonium transporter Rh